jgi:hypothetical protein
MPPIPTTMEFPTEPSTPPRLPPFREQVRRFCEGIIVSSTTQQYPVHVLRELLPGAGYAYEAQWSDDLQHWQSVPWASLIEVNRQTGAAGQTDLVTLRMPESIAQAAAANPRRFHRVVLRQTVP